MTKEDFDAIRAIIQEETRAIVQQELVPIKQDIADMKQDIVGIKQDIVIMKEDIAELKEDAAITREATNSLVEWAENVSVITQVKFPVSKAKAE